MTAPVCLASGVGPDTISAPAMRFAEDECLSRRS